MPLSASDLSQLWDGDVIRLPDNLRAKYRDMLSRLGFLESALRGCAGAGPIGGASAQETEEHFTHRFGAGGSRIQYVVVSGNMALKQVASDLLTAISDGNIRLLDLPCGAGASSSTFLSLLTDLRAKQVLPATPLNVSLIGADFSPRARSLFSDLIKDLAPIWASGGVKVEAEAMDWNATRSDSTAVMMDRVLDESSFTPDEYVVLITNFSGEASRAAFFREFSPCLEQILARLSTKRHTVVWLEPRMAGTRDLLDRLLEFLRQRIPWISSAEGTTNVEARYRSQHPITQEIHGSSVALLRHVRR